MTVHQIEFRYDGLSASGNHLPPSLERHVTDGAQILIGAAASYFSEGRVPDRIMDRTPFYQLSDFRQHPGSWIAAYDLTWHAAAMGSGYYFTQLAWDAAGDAVKDFAKRQLREKFNDFFCEVVTAWKARRLITDPCFDRVEPVLQMPRANMPMIDVAAEQEQQRRRLYVRTADAMTKISSPIHRAATHVDIYIDGHHVDHTAQRFYSDAEIMEALLPLRDVDVYGGHPTRQ